MSPRQISWNPTSISENLLVREPLQKHSLFPFILCDCFAGQEIIADEGRVMEHLAMLASERSSRGLLLTHHRHLGSI